MGVITLPYPRTRPRVQGWTAAAAAIAAVLLVGLLLALRNNVNVSSWQPESWLFDDLVPITAENADQLTRLDTIGRGRVNDIAWSPDGSTMAVGAQTGVYLYDTANLSEEAMRKLPAFEDEAVYLVYSPDGTMLAIQTNSAIELRDAVTGAAIRQLEPEGKFGRLFGFHPDGQHLIATSCPEASPPGSYCTESDLVWVDLQTGESMIRQSEVETRYGALSPDQHRLAVVGIDDSISVWDLLTDVTEPMLNINTSIKQVQTLAFSPDGSLLAFSGFGNAIPNPVVVWNVETEKQVSQHASATRNNAVLSMFFAPDGDSLIYSSFVPPVYQWSLADGSYQPLELQTMSSQLTLSPNGRLIVGSDRAGSLSVYDVQDWSNSQLLLSVDTYTSYSGDVQFSPAKRQIAFTSFGKHAIWDYEANVPFALLQRDSLNDPYDNSREVSAFSPDGAFLYVNEHRPTTEPFSLKIWDAQNGVRDFEGENLPEFAGISDIIYTPDGELVMVTQVGRFATGTTSIYRAGQQIPLVDEIPFQDRFTSFRLDVPESAISSDGSLAAIAGCFEAPSEQYIDCAAVGIAVVDAETGKTLAMIETDIQGSFGSPITPHLHRTESGQVLLAAAGGTDFLMEEFEDGSRGGTFQRYIVQVWDITDLVNGITEQATPLHTFDTTTRWNIADLAFSPDGGLLAAATYPDAVVYDLETGELLKTLSGTSSTSVQFSDDGTILAVGERGVVHLWGVLP